MYAKKLALLAVAAVFLTTACTTYKIHYRDATAVPGGKVHTKKQGFLLWGLVGGEPLELDRLCPQGVARIDSKNSATDSILFLITGGLYAPMSVEIQCVGGAAFQRTRSDDGSSTLSRLEPKRSVRR